MKIIPSKGLKVLALLKIRRRSVNKLLLDLPNFIILMNEV